MMVEALRSLSVRGPGADRGAGRRRGDRRPDPAETAQQVWSAVHGAVALELKGLLQGPDPLASYEALLATLLRGLAP
jgi:hypothetical protein